MEFTNEVYDAINRYFSSLAHTGYKSYKQVNNLIVMSFLEELLTGPLSEFITEKDYNSIVNCIYCIYGTCMIPFPEYKRAVDEVVTNLDKSYRVTEDNLMRASEVDGLRIKS